MLSKERVALFGVQMDWHAVEFNDDLTARDCSIPFAS